jgi:hypothetical protein
MGRMDDVPRGESLHNHLVDEMAALLRVALGLRTPESILRLRALADIAANLPTDDLLLLAAGITENQGQDLGQDDASAA